MKKVVSIVVFIVMMTCILFALTGCTLKIETTDNSVSASVDGDTTEKVDNILEWIKERLRRIFTSTAEENNSSTNTNTSTSTNTNA